MPIHAAFSDPEQVPLLRALSVPPPTSGPSGQAKEAWWTPFRPPCPFSIIAALMNPHLQQRLQPDGLDPFAPSGQATCFVVPARQRSVFWGHGAPRHPHASQLERRVLLQEEITHHHIERRSSKPDDHGHILTALHEDEATRIRESRFPDLIRAEHDPAPVVRADLRLERRAVHLVGQTYHARFGVVQPPPRAPRPAHGLVASFEIHVVRLKP